MNKFAFFFPAKIAFAESAVELSPIKFRGEAFYLGPLGKNVYFSCDKGKIVVSKNGDDMIQIFVKVGEYFCNMTNTPETNVSVWLENKLETIKELRPKWESQINNPELYEQEAAKTRAKIKAENEERDKQIAAQKLERQQATRKAYEQSLVSFVNKEMIEWDHFEDALNENNIKLPIKTLGYGRANVSKIGQTGYSVRGSSHNSPVLWAAIRELAAKLH